MRAYPLPNHGGVDQRRAPQRIAQSREGPEERAHGIVLDEADFAGSDRGDADVEHPEVQALDVRYISGDVIRHDLTLAALCRLVGAGNTVQQGEAACRPVALANDVLIRLELRHLHRQSMERGPLVFREREEGDALDLAKNPSSLPRSPARARDPAAISAQGRELLQPRHSSNPVPGPQLKTATHGIKLYENTRLG
jgi:hypothetical protein